MAEEDDLSLEEFEAMLQEIDQKNDKIIEAILNGSQGKDAIVLADKTHTQGVVITVSAKNPHLFQATYFNERGFTTHETASVRDTLIRRAVEHNGMTELDDSLLEQFAKEPGFLIQNATYWYQNQHAGETAIRDLVVSNAPREGAKNFDPLFAAFCRAYQEELQKRHIKIIPGKKANLTLSERTQITKAVTQKLIQEGKVTENNLYFYQQVLSIADPSQQVPRLEDLQSMIHTTTKKPKAKSERKRVARAIVQEDVKKLFEKLQNDLHLTPDDVTKLVHEAASQAKTQSRSAAR